MTKDESHEKPAGRTIDRKSGIEIDGEKYYPLDHGLCAPGEMNPCAGKRNGASCGPGCICQNGQCYYMLFRLQQMGLTLGD